MSNHNLNTLMRFLTIFIVTFFISICQAKESHHITPHRIRVNSEYDSLIDSQITSELNIYQGSVYSNIFFEYETENQFKIGAYFNNMPIETGHYNSTYTYDSYLGFSKWFDINNKFKIGIGSQNGSQLYGSPKNFLSFEFLQTQYKVNHMLTVGVGMYYANNALTTTNTNIGSIVSIYYSFIPKTVWAEFDWYSGETNISGSVLNTFFKINNHTNFYLGLQIPASNSGNEFAGNIGLVFHTDR